MAVEAKRGCGYRKVGNTYLVGGGIGIPCDRLPLKITVCPCCSAGIKQSRGWTWVDVPKLVEGVHKVNPPYNHNDSHPEKIPCKCGLKTPRFTIPCPLCHEPEKIGRGGLLWVGESFYKTTEEFIAEGVAYGFSKRINTIPRGFKIGKTYVLLAHPKAVREMVEVEKGAVLSIEEAKFSPGIFYMWLPQRIEKILPESLRGSEAEAKLEKQGITPVFVPDDDPDHKGSVYDKKEETLFEEEVANVE